MGADDECSIQVLPFLLLIVGSFLIFFLKWLYDTAADTWSDSLDASSQHRLENGGFFAQRVKGFKDLIAISLNMNFGDPENWWLLADSTDPYEMLQWLSDTLQKAEDNGDKVRKVGASS